MPRDRQKVLAAAFGALSLCAEHAAAHEFWIEPASAVVQPGGRIEAGLKVGRMLEGDEHPFLRDRFVRFTIAANGETRALEGRDGDRPAVSFEASGPGLHVIAHETIGFRATYEGRKLFEQFLDEEGYLTEGSALAERATPERFVERYYRHAKALVPVGADGAVAETRPVGLALELIATTSPFETGGRKLVVRLLRNGRPVARRQVSIFHKDDGGTSRFFARTDGDGAASLPLSGRGLYLVSAVTLEPVEEQPVLWVSRWASLSFRR